ncbi:MAG: hypothetical protein CBD18_03605 [Opitutales bacterium TMED158]|nr:MAG: hypothetical protein CBD18_03605 [Opitutales bacterium TMED158]
MPTIYALKPAFQRLLEPACQYLGKRGIHPNQVTQATTVICIVYGALLALAPNSRLVVLLLPALLLGRMALNAIDGMLATRFDRKTRKGALLNEMGDVVSDCALYLPLAVRPELNPVLVILVSFIGILVEMIGVASIQIGSSRRYDGPIGKSDRAFIFGLIALFIGLGIDVQGWLNALLVATIALSAYTIYNRGRKALSEKRPAN